MVENYEFLTIKRILINKSKSSKKLSKIFARKNVRMKQKKLHALI